MVLGVAGLPWALWQDSIYVFGAFFIAVALGLCVVIVYASNDRYKL